MKKNSNLAVSQGLGFNIYHPYCRATNQKFIFKPQTLGSSWPFAISYREDLFSNTTTYGHLLSLSYEAFFPDKAGFSYLLAMTSGSQHKQLCKNHIHFESTQQTQDCPCCCYAEGGAGANRQTNP